MFIKIVLHRDFYFQEKNEKPKRNSNLRKVTIHISSVVNLQFSLMYRFSSSSKYCIDVAVVRADKQVDQQRIRAKKEFERQLDNGICSMITTIADKIQSYNVEMLHHIEIVFRYMYHNIDHVHYSIQSKHLDQYFEEIHQYSESMDHNH